MLAGLLIHNVLIKRFNNSNFLENEKNVIFRTGVDIPSSVERVWRTVLV
jgi:hypothetical protein